MPHHPNSGGVILAIHVEYSFEQQWWMLIPTVVSSARVQLLLGLKKHTSSMENHLILREAASFGISNQLNSKLQLICLQRTNSDVAQKHRGT